MTVTSGHFEALTVLLQSSDREEQTHAGSRTRTAANSSLSKHKLCSMWDTKRQCLHLRLAAERYRWQHVGPDTAGRQRRAGRFGSNHLWEDDCAQERRWTHFVSQHLQPATTVGLMTPTTTLMRSNLTTCTCQCLTCVEKRFFIIIHEVPKHRVFHLKKSLWESVSWVSGR